MVAQPREPKLISNEALFCFFYYYLRSDFGAISYFRLSVNAASLSPTCCANRETPPSSSPARLSVLPPEAGTRFSLLATHRRRSMAANRVIVYGGRGALGSKCVQHFKSKGWVSGGQRARQRAAPLVANLVLFLCLNSGLLASTWLQMRRPTKT